MFYNKLCKIEIRKKFLIMSIWAKHHHITNFPSKLKCLEERKPSTDQLKNDYKTINSFDNHPAYITFCLGYNPNINCQKE